MAGVVGCVSILDVWWQNITNDKNYPTNTNAMSFDWNLSSDEEDAYDDWAKVDLNESLTGQTKAVARATETSFDKTNDDDEASSSSDEDDRDLPTKSHFAGVAFYSGDLEDEEGEDDDEIDWEDVGHQSKDDSSSTSGAKISAELAANKNQTAEAGTAAASSPRPITLNLNDNDSNKGKGKGKSKKSTRKWMARRRYRFEQLTPQLQFLLSHLEKAHLLSLTATAMVISNYCSHPETLGVAHSLIPPAWIQDPLSTPTLSDVNAFCSFYFRLIHPGNHLSADAVARRPRKWKGREKHRNDKLKTVDQASSESGSSSAPPMSVPYRTSDYASFLAARSLAHDLPSQLARGDYHQYDYVQLLIAMTRSMGWRTRFVTVLEPCRRDLDPNHALFVAMSTQNVFQRIWKQNSKNRRTDAQKKPPKRFKTEKSQDFSEVSSSKYRKPVWSLLDPASASRSLPLCWVEILCQTSTPSSLKKSKLHWVHLDPTRELINAADSVEVALHAQREGIDFRKTLKKRPIPYALAVEHLSLSNDKNDDDSLKLRLTDVTPRYSSSFVESLKARGVVRGKKAPLENELGPDKWWAAVLKTMNAASHRNPRSGRTPVEAIVLDNDDEDKKPAAADSHFREVDEQEEKQFQESKQKEPIPTSKTAFKSNPIYTLPSLLNTNEVLKPDAKERICGVFKGEFVIRRSEVETALPASKWLYKGRKVKHVELSKPVKRVKARNTSTSKSFKALKSYGVGTANDGTEETRDKILDEASQDLPDGTQPLYASWQTDPWSPSPVGPNDQIPANDHNNIELALLNPGLVHIDERNVAKVAKKLDIPYVPCLLGFEGHGGNRTPTIRGIVVHQHNEEILREAHQEMASHFLQEEHENRQRTILLRWKRLMVGVLTKERLEKAYG